MHTLFGCCSYPHIYPPDPHNWDILENPAPTNRSITIIPGMCRTVQHPGYSRMSDTFFTPRNNLLSYGIWTRKREKPATESTSVQGGPLLSQPFVSCPEENNHRFDTFMPERSPTIGETRGFGRSRKVQNGVKLIKTGEIKLKTSYKTGNNGDIPRIPLSHGEGGSGPWRVRTVKKGERGQKRPSWQGKPLITD